MGPSLQNAGSAIAMTLRTCDFADQKNLAGVLPQPVKYVDASRTLATYIKSINLPGTSGVAGFLAAAARNCRGSFNPALTASAVNRYLLGGFTAA